MASKLPLFKHTKHIDLPGQTVDLETGTDTTVILRKHRDVIFHFALQNVKKIEVKVPGKSVAKSTLYDPKQKKLVKTLTIPNGAPYPVWIGREFNAEISVFGDGKLIGRYNPKKLDPSPVDPAPPFKPQPILIGFKEDAKAGAGQCTPDDPYGIGAAFHQQQPWLGKNLDFVSTLKDLQDYQYKNLLPELTPQQRVVMHVLPLSMPAAQSLPESHELAVKPDELEKYLNQTQLQAFMSSTLDGAAGSTLFKSAADYVKDNRHWRERLSGQMRLKKVRGQLMLVWVGRSDPNKLKHLPGTTYGMANPKVAGVTGGYTVKSNQPFRRFALSALQTTGNNALDAVKPRKALGPVGFVLDVYGDYRKVFHDQNGSKDVTEFLGRAGLSLVSAGASAALGGALAGVGMMLTSAVYVAAGITMPVAVVLVVGFVAFLLASTIIDNTLGSDTAKRNAGAITK
ncbi:hypothetical protein [Vogesella indigofera]|uniref:hypothetical protein n=1 Tax=Vogesella indigofera TaxID=45465 RepID=UPI00234CF468|nr:hypothetical protein [Vogesella indigofera]MDC7704603.1 hypothetical protein [Vogesella indigofera]